MSQSRRLFILFLWYLFSLQASDFVSFQPEYPVDLYSGRASYETIREFQIGPEVIEIPIKYKSPTKRDSAGWEVMGHCIAKKWGVADGDVILDGLLLPKGEKSISHAGEVLAYHYDDGLFTVLYQNGRERIYSCYSQHVLRLEKEKTPQGNLIEYEYLGMDLLAKVQVFSSDHKKLYGQLNFQYPKIKKKDPSFTIKSDEGESLSFRYVQEGKEYLLKSIEGLGQPEEVFRYKEARRKKLMKRPIHLLDKIDHPGGNYTGFLWDLESLRVSSIWKDGNLHGRVCIAAFTYHDKKTEVLDADGILESYYFDDYGRYQKIKKGLYAKSFAYNQKNLCIRELFEGPRGDRGQKERLFDEKKRLIKETLLYNETELSTKYTYDHRNRLSSLQDQSGKSQVFTYVKDTGLIQEASDGCITIANEYDQDGLLIKVTTSDGNFVDHSKEITRDNYRIAFEDSGEEKRAYSYDERGNVLVKRVLDKHHKICHEEAYVYDSFDLVTCKKSSDSGVVSFAYNQQRKLIEETHPDCAIKYAYDRLGYLKTLDKVASSGSFIHEEFINSPTGKVLRKTSTEHCDIVFEYDEFGRCIHNDKGFYRFDLMGNVIYHQDQSGRETKWVYGVFKDPLKVIYPDQTSEITRFSVDGLVRYCIDRSGHEMEIEYDSYGRLISKTKGDRQTKFCYKGKKLSQIQANSQIVANLTYDRFGRIELEDRLGVEKRYRYDYLGHLQSIEEGGVTTLYKRDGLGRVLEKWDGFSYSSYAYDQKGHVSQTFLGLSNQQISKTKIYDGLNKVLKEYTPFGSEIEYQYQPKELHQIDRQGREVVTIYDDQKRVIKKKRNGFVEELFYDAASNLIEKQESRLDRTYRASFAYDSCNRLTEINDEFGQHRKEYNGKGELVFERRQGGAELFYEYNEHGELISLKSSDQTIAYRYEYNEFGKVVQTYNDVTKEICSRHYDENQNLCLEEQENGVKTEYTYKEGKKTRLTLLDDSQIHYVYTQGKPTRIYRTNQSQQIIYDHLLQYNTHGLVDKEEMIFGLGTISRSYDFDLLLKQMTTPYHHQTIKRRDLQGNVIELITDHKESIFSVNALGEVVCAKDDVYSSRIHGKLCQLGQIEYEYDALDRLILVRSGGMCAKLNYDAFHRLMSIECNGSKQRYIYDEMIEIGAVDHDGRIDQLRVVVPTGNMDMGATVAIELEGIVYAPIHDLFGNIIGLVNQDREVVASYETDIFGNEKALSGVVSPWRFGSKRKCDFGGFYIYGLRPYFPSLHEFGTLDQRGDHETLDLTHFNYGNPLVFRDPWGLDPEKREACWAYPALENLITAPQVPLSLLNMEMYFYNEKIMRPNPDDIKHYPGRDQASRDHAVVLINGIRNKEEDCRYFADRVATSYGGKVVSIYNRTNGVFSDVARVAHEFMKIDTAPVINLRNVLMDLHKDGYKNIHLITHSEGCLIAKRGLETVPERIRNKINVFALASPTFIPKCYANQTHHYYSSQDIIDKFAAFTLLVEMAKGHRATYQYEHSKIIKFGEHSLSSPTYSMILDQVLESLES